MPTEILLQDKTMTYQEYMVFCRQSFEKLLNEMIKQRKWDKLPLWFGTLPPYNSQLALYICSSLIPKDLLYRITIDVYTSDGYNFPKKLIIDLKKCKPQDYLQDLPKKYDKTDQITVYRASSTSPENISKLRCECSWSLKKSVAQRFCEILKRNGLTPYIYKAVISKKDIIAYTNCREEFEVIQHLGVKNLKLIS